MLRQYSYHTKRYVGSRSGNPRNIQNIEVPLDLFSATNPLTHAGLLSPAGSQTERVGKVNMAFEGLLESPPNTNCRSILDVSNQRNSYNQGLFDIASESLRVIYKEVRSMLTIGPDPRCHHRTTQLHIFLRIPKKQLHSTKRHYFNISQHAIHACPDPYDH